MSGRGSSRARVTSCWSSLYRLDDISDDTVSEDCARCTEQEKADDSVKSNCSTDDENP